MNMDKSRKNKKLFRDWATERTNSDNNDWRSFIRQQSRLAGEKLSSEEVYDMLWYFFEQDMLQPSEMDQFSSDISSLINGEKTLIKVPLDLSSQSQIPLFIQQLKRLNIQDKNYIKYGNKFYTISSKNINKLIKLLKGEEVSAINESDKQIDDWIKSGEDFEIGRVAGGTFMLEEDEEEEDTIVDDNSAPGGAWFPYYLREDLPLDLTRYDIHKSRETEDLDTNCLILALNAYGIPSEQLEFCKCLVKNRVVPEKDIRKVAIKIRHNIKIHKYDKNGKKQNNYKIVDKNYPNINLINIDNHFILDEKIIDPQNQITKYALLNWEDVKHLRNPKKIYDITDKQIKRSNDRIIKTSSELVKVLKDNENKLLIKKKLNNTLLESQFWDKEKDFETLSYDPDLNTSPNTLKRLKRFGGANEEDEITIGENDLTVREIVPPKATYVADFETISAQSLPEKGDNGIRVYTRKKANEKMVVHKPYFWSYSEYKTGKPIGHYIDKMTTKTKYKQIEDDLKTICVINYPRGADISPRSKEKIRIIFHNAGYDVRFLRPYLSNYQQIDKGSKLISGEGIFHYKWGGYKCAVKIEIRDSYGIIPVALGNFGKIFPNISQEKEILPYSFYTEENCLEKNYILNVKDLDKYQELEKEEDRKQFINNCRKWRLIKEKGRKISRNPTTQKALKQEGDIDMRTYSGKYCNIDVKVLEEGLKLYQESISKISSDNKYGYAPIDVLEYVSLPSLIFDILLMKGCFDETYTISGVPQQFIQRCVVGGRCMLKDNQKQYFTEFKKDGKLYSIQDYDSVSCYTSAFVRMKGLLKGIPKPIEGSEYEKIFTTTKKNNKYINSLVDAYFIKIKVIKVNTARHFPVVSAMRDNIRDWSNDLVGAEIYCDNLALDDFIEFQGLEFKIIEGYYFNDGFNPTIVNVMRDLFQQRIVAKNNIVVKNGDKTIEVFKLDSKIEGLANKAPELVKENIERLKKKYKGKNYSITKYKNPIEVVYKLLLNSCYGKMLLKEIETETEYVKKISNRLMSKKKLNELGLPPKTQKWEKYSPFLKTLNRHYNKIKEWEDCGEEVKITYWKSINDHHNNVHQGVQVLSYAKRLMNEVICLAEDNNCEILYTDTDSIHIVDKHIPILEEAFKNKYKRELRGEDLNQFNEDFDSNIKNVRSVKFIGLGKKCYIDVLKGDGEETDYHIRLKGCPNQSILREAERRKITPETLYELMYDDTRISFDLLKKLNNHIKSRFVFNSDWTITNETNFNRSICFNKNKKNLIDEIISGKKKFWGKTNEFKEWKNKNKVVLAVQSEVSIAD